MKRVSAFLALALCAAALLSGGCGREGGMDRATVQLLNELDGYVAARNVYVARKLDDLDAMRRLVQVTHDPELRYEAEMNMADAYFSFSFDSTQAYLKNCQDIALKQLQDRGRYDRASIQLGHLYAKAGSYMEAYHLLYDQIDTLHLSDEAKTDYLLALYDFSMDLAGNSGQVEQLDTPDAGWFRERLFQLLPRDTDSWRTLRRDELIEQGLYASADSLAHLQLAATHPDEHAYAIVAFHLSQIAERMGRPADRMAWLVRSAESDIINAVKDYASLTMVAQSILQSDVDRSFRYLRIAQEDALFYNAKLRPWQISRSLIEVQDAYSALQERQRKISVHSSILLALMTAALALLAWFYIGRSRKLSRMRAELEESNQRLAVANETLAGLNQQISESDRVKEDYIISFLSGLANQIQTVRTNDNYLRNLLKRGKADQLLKELSASSRAEKARDEFYRTFDATFLAMYPRFVEQFNAMLQEDARIHPPQGQLSTELRIFALIKLGVDDSKQIARMLDYSLSTIYNYKVSVKNAAVVDRDKFEMLVKEIGK
ncbi:MAG: hypothetical protein J5702_01555 [Bacteroidales bacterium]|nr:hypothetical protein [Bacteroidales bacterium]